MTFFFLPFNNMNNQKDKHEFYKQIRRISSLPEDQRQQELKEIADSNNEDANNLRTGINAFKDAQSNVSDIRDTLRKKDEIIQKIKETDDKSQDIYRFYDSNQQTISKISEFKLKRDFCNSIQRLCSVPNEILKEVKNKEYQLATKYLISMMKIISNPKYNSQILNVVKQQFTEKFIHDLYSISGCNMLILLNNEDSIHKSVQALGFQITCYYYNIAELNNPTAKNDIESKRSSITDTLSTYFSYHYNFLTRKTSEVVKQFISAGQTLQLIDNDIQNVILKFPYFDSPGDEQIQEDNNKIKNDIISLSKEYYLKTYKKFVNFSQLDGIFYTKRNIFQISNYINFAEQSKQTKTIQSCWGQLIPNAVNMSSIILISGIIDLYHACKTEKEINATFLQRFDKLYSLVQNIKNTKEQKLPDITFLGKIFQTYHSCFCFDPTSEKFINTFITFVQFSMLLKFNDRVYNLFYGNFSSRITSALGNYMANSVVKGLDIPFIRIEEILNDVYFDESQNSENPNNNVSFYNAMHERIERSEANKGSIVNRIAFQALNGITSHFLCEPLDAITINNGIKENEISILKWSLRLRKKNEGLARDLVAPYIKLLKVQKND